MTADDLNRLPQFIDGTGDGMWPIEPGTVETAACRYVKLADVLALINPPASPVPGFICLGLGSADLKERAIVNGWDMHCHFPGDLLTGGWRGDSDKRIYYIKE